MNITDLKLLASIENGQRFEAWSFALDGEKFIYITHKQTEAFKSSVPNKTTVYPARSYINKVHMGPTVLSLPFHFPLDQAEPMKSLEQFYKLSVLQ